MHKAKTENARSDAFSALVIGDARVFKSGNSLAIRIPNAIAKRIELEDGVTVQIGLDDGMLFVRKTPNATLEELIERITPENTHAAIFDDVIESERW